MKYMTRIGDDRTNEGFLFSDSSIDTNLVKFNVFSQEKSRLDEKLPIRINMRKIVGSSVSCLAVMPKNTWNSYPF